MNDIRLQKTSTESELHFCAELMFHSDPWITYGFSVKQCIEALEGDHKEIYIAILTNKKVGFVVLNFQGVLRGYIQTLCIQSEFRSLGIGTLLLKFSENRIFNFFPNVFLCVSSFNLKAQKLYYNLGYKKIGELKNHISQGYDEFIMQKNISSLMEFSKKTKGYPP